MHLEKGIPPQRIADELNITSTRVLEMIGDQRLSKKEQRKREKEYLKSKAREIMKETNFEEKVQKHIKEANTDNSNQQQRTEKFGQKLTEQEAGEVKWLARNTDVLYKKIAKQYPISKSYITQIKNGRTWKEVDPKKPNDYGNE